MCDFPMSEDRFSGLGRQYENTLTSPFRAYVEIPSVLAAVGEVSGRAVLDAGCGTGGYARLLARRGAERVVGVDVSEGMLAVAREVEERAQLGIDYRVGDIARAPWSAGSGGLASDVVVAVYLLSQARTGADLRAMCRGLAALSRPGGRLVTAALDPDFSEEPGWYRDYGMSLRMPGRNEEGGPVEISIDQGGSAFDIVGYCWSRQTLESALREAGFVEIAWARPRVSREGVERHGRAYWSACLARPHASIVSARPAGNGA